MKALVLTLGVLAVMIQTAQAADVYRWKDSEGKVHYTDRPENIPREYQKKKEPVDIEPRQPISTDDSGEFPKSTPMRSRMGSVKEKGRPDSPEVFVAPLYSAGGSGSFMVETRFNNLHVAKLVLDTGASMMVITKKLAEEMGVAGIENLPKIPVATAGGRSWIYLTSFDTVAVGGAVANDVVTGISLDLHAGFGGLLGMTYLSEFIYQIDALSGKLMLKRGNGNEIAYGGMPKSWWVNRYKDIVTNIKKYETLEALAANSISNRYENILRNYPGMTLEDFSKLSGFYRRLFSRLDRRASSVGVPTSWRLYP